jgi:hypothetical protein
MGFCPVSAAPLIGNIIWKVAVIERLASCRVLTDSFPASHLFSIFITDLRAPEASWPLKTEELLFIGIVDAETAAALGEPRQRVKGYGEAATSSSAIELPPALDLGSEPPL